MTVRFVTIQGKANVVADAFSRKYDLAQGEASKVGNATAENRAWPYQQMEKKMTDGGYILLNKILTEEGIALKGEIRTIIMDETHASRYLVHPGAYKTYYDLGDMHWWPCMKKDIATYVSDCLTCSKVKDETSKTFGLKAARDRKNSYADNRRKPLEFEVGDQVLQKVSPWKGVDTFHVSNLKKCLADANLHMPLGEVKIDKTLHFIKEHVEIMDREVKKLKRSRILIVKVCWNSKRGHEGDGSSKNYKVLSEMLEDFDRLDAEELYNLVKERYSTSRPEGYDQMLWGDLHTLFEPDEDDEIWKDQHEYNLISWRLCDFCGIHILLMENGLAIHMLTEKKYPLSQEMISKMLKKKLEVDHESSQAFELLRFIRSQVKK
ncbi:putative reverse transcriptase domain-containing protein [Tanacetum coccineum]